MQNRRTAGVGGGANEALRLGAGAGSKMLLNCALMLLVLAVELVRAGSGVGARVMPAPNWLLKLEGSAVGAVALVKLPKLSRNAWGTVLLVLLLVVVVPGWVAPFRWQRARVERLLRVET